MVGKFHGNKNMALRNLGYDQARNLAESIDDRQALNNLGGGSIADDISIFRNNTNNFSELEWSYETLGSSIVGNKFLFPTSLLATYTNNDSVYVSGTSLGSLSSDQLYYVVQYNPKSGARSNQISFGLSLTVDGSLVALGSITSHLIFTRNDFVNQNNIINIASPQSRNTFFLTQTNLELEVDATYGVNNYNQGFSALEENLDRFSSLSAQKYTSNKSLATSNIINTQGFITTSDPAVHNTSQVNLNEVNSPGVYITDPFSDIFEISKTRAYSSDNQPWVQGVTSLDTKSSQVNIGDLYFENDIKFDSIDGFNTESGAASSFTHKIPIIIDGVEYFILLTQ